MAEGSWEQKVTFFPGKVTSGPLFLISLFFPLLFLKQVIFAVEFGNRPIGVKRLLYLISVEWLQVLKFLKTDWPWALSVMTLLFGIILQ